MTGRGLTKENLILTLGATLVASALTLMLAPWLFSSQAGFNSDGVRYMGYAHQLLQHGTFALDAQDNFFNRAGMFLPAGTPNYATAPGYFPVLAGALAIWDDWRASLVLNMAFFAASCWAGLWILAAAGAGRIARLVFCAAMVFDPSYLFFDGGVQVETQAAFLAIAFAALWFAAWRGGMRNLFLLLGAGLCGGAATLTRGNLLPFMLILLFAMLANRAQALTRRHVLRTALVLAVMMAVVGSWALRNFQIAHIWYPTGSAGPVGQTLEVNFALGGTRTAPVLIWPEGDQAAFGASLRAHGETPVQAEAETDREVSRQVLRYVARHPVWAARVYGASVVRFFLASIFDEPDWIAGRLGGHGGPAFVAASKIFVFGFRGIVLLAFLAFPILLLRRAVAPVFGMLWAATLIFALMTAFVAVGHDRYRLPVESVCLIFVALWLQYLSALRRAAPAR
jgi:hypothetical protein